MGKTIKRHAFSEQPKEPCPTQQRIIYEKEILEKNLAKVNALREYIQPFFPSNGDTGLDRKTNAIFWEIQSRKNRLIDCENCNGRCQNNEG
jgi:hypothetical protein